MNKLEWFSLKQVIVFLVKEDINELETDVEYKGKQYRVKVILDDL